MYSLAGMLDVCDRLLDFVPLRWVLGNDAFIDQEMGQRDVEHGLGAVRR